MTEDHPDPQHEQLRALLGDPTATPDELSDRIGKVRPFTAGTFALLHQTVNEFILGIEPEDMANPHFATLAWLYIQAGPLEEVRAVAFNLPRFQQAVLAWADRLDADGQPLLTPSMLAAATSLITDTLTAKAAADFTVKAKPGSAKPDPDAPPN